MANPLIPNQIDILQDQYAACLSKLKIDLPVKLCPITQFLKNLAVLMREKQEKLNQTGSATVRFPQVFYQAFILTTGIIDDIDELLKVFECSQWACLPIQIVFVNIHQNNIQEHDLDSLKLRDHVQKYNEEVAGWAQLQIKFLGKKDLQGQLENLSEEVGCQILKTVEDYMFVNQIVNRDDLDKDSE